jgi:hypothetical protein
MNLTIDTGSQLCPYGIVKDPTARDWLIDLHNKVETMDKEPDWHIAQEGNLGFRLIIVPTPNEDGIRVSIHLNTHKYREWAEAHKYMMEDLLTFRIGPIILAHPGRNKSGKRECPINIWDMEFCILGEDGHEWLSLFTTSAAFEVRRVGSEYEVLRSK